MNRLFVIALSLSLFCLSLGPSSAPQDSGTKTHLKAMMIYQFATKIDWPKEYKTGSFVIGVYGNSDLYDKVVSDHSSKPVGSQPIKVKKYSSSKDIERCHILFVDKSKSAAVPALAKKFKSKGTLLVTEYDKGLNEGATINFVVINNRDKFELSKSNASSNGLVLSSYIQGFAVNL